MGYELCKVYRWAIEPILQHKVRQLIRRLLTKFQAFLTTSIFPPDKTTNSGSGVFYPVWPLGGLSITAGPIWRRIRRDRVGMWGEEGSCKNSQKCPFST